MKSFVFKIISFTSNPVMHLNSMFLTSPPAPLLKGEGRDVLDFFYEFINSVYYFIYIKTGHAFRFVVFDLTPNPSPARRGEQSGIDLSFI